MIYVLRAILHLKSSLLSVSKFAQTTKTVYSIRALCTASVWTDRGDGSMVESRLVNLDQQMHANAVVIAYIRLSQEVHETYKEIPCHLNLATGINIVVQAHFVVKSR